MKENPSQRDIDLLSRIAQHDGEAIAMLMRVYYNDLYDYAARFSLQDAAIKDCIQEVFISLWQRRETAGSILAPKFYLLRAIKNKVLKTLDSAHRKIGNVPLPDEYDFSHDLAIEKLIIAREVSEENAVRLRSILLKLTKREKEVIYCKFYQHLDNAQIAELMNLSRQSVYNLLHESINKLKSLWHKAFVSQ